MTTQEPTNPAVAEAIKLLESVNKAVSSAITTPFLPPLPSYALKYAPLFYLNDKEEFWPGNPLDLLTKSHPETKSGEKVAVAEDVIGKFALLDLPTVNTTETFLVSNDDPRNDEHLPVFVSPNGKPDASGKSGAACWIIHADKGAVVRPGVVDIFYFLFYPYNNGNPVAGTHYGNHVGDWENVMIRFENGTPIAANLSAHSSGNSYAWKTLEKSGDRPIVYIASGSHAMYGRTGTIYYNVPLVGPADRTSKGPLWDPVKNYVPASFSPSTHMFSNLSSPTGATSNPVTPADILYVLNFKGRWGNSFSDIRNMPEKWFNTIQRKLALLMWSEGPTGPRDKSLHRVWMSWDSDRLEPKL